MSTISIIKIIIFNFLLRTKEVKIKHNKSQEVVVAISINKNLKKLKQKKLSLKRKNNLK